LASERIETGMTENTFQTIAELSRAIEAGSLDPVALTQAYFDRIDGVGRALNCYVVLCRDQALADAVAAKQRAVNGRRLGPLDGIPLGLKDNIDMAGLPTSNGFGGPSPMAATDAEVVCRLRAAGAVILGKLNMHEGALGGVTNNPHFGPTTNPWREGFTPGGSSGGSGAAVAAGLCAAALGTDTGGSVRIPASYCGVVGLKPSFGLISTRGVVPLSIKLDHVGVLTRTVEDADLLLAVLAGFDPHCSESRRAPLSGATTLSAPDLQGLRLGVMTNLEAETTSSDVSRSFEVALSQLQHLGAKVTKFELPSYDAARARRAVFVLVQVGAALAHGDAWALNPARFSTNMQGLLTWGAKASALQLLKADRIVDQTVFALEQCWDHFDAIVSPTTPQAAFPFNQPPPANQGGFCVLANVAGSPAISVPMGLDAGGLPLGLQIVAARHQEQLVLRIARAFERAAALNLAPPQPYGPTR
jgi:Asp-tRNA(Asn)/Glu-tRNA(Gln) amidotransferase A subunit family amidase